MLMIRIKRILKKDRKVQLTKGIFLYISKGGNN